VVKFHACSSDDGINDHLY